MDDALTHLRRVREKRIAAEKTPSPPKGEIESVTHLIKTIHRMRWNMIANITNILRDSAPINWGDVATWVTGFATLLLFIVALFQIRVERMARIKRERDRKHALDGSS